MASAAFYQDVQSICWAYFSCGWGVRELRHACISIAREFIPPNEAFRQLDEVLADSADHSTGVDQAHYAISVGTLPQISQNKLEEHRWLSEEWHNALGIGKGEATKPLRLRASKAPNPCGPSRSPITFSDTQEIMTFIRAQLAEAIANEVQVAAKEAAKKAVESLSAGTAGCGKPVYFSSLPTTHDSCCSRFPTWQ